MGGVNRPRCIPFQSPYPLPNSARSCPVLCSHLNPPKLLSRVRSPRAASSWVTIKGGPKHELRSQLPGRNASLNKGNKPKRERGPPVKKFQVVNVPCKVPHA